jgi:glycosyltransferase involved in cell wall biosynthesis
MHIAINATVTPPRPFGVGNYILELIKNLRQHRPAWRITIFGYRGYKKLFLDTFGNDVNVEIIELPFFYEPRLVSIPLTIIWFRVFLDHQLDRMSADVFWHPNTAYIPKLKVPIIATIHDLLEYEVQSYSYPVTLFRKWNLRIISKRCSAIVTVSNFSASRIRHFLGVNHGMITVIPPFVRLNECDRSIEKGKTILTVSNEKEYKNTKQLVSAFKASKLNTKGWNLIICGSFKDRNFHNFNGIHISGYLDNKALDELYLKSSIYVSTSLYEGYDLPVREAYNTNCRLLLSDIPVHREFYEQSAVFFMTEDVNDLRIKLMRLADEY